MGGRRLVHCCGALILAKKKSIRKRTCHLQVAMLGKNLSHLTSGGGEDGEQQISKKKDFLMIFLIFSGEDLYVFGSIVRKLRVEEEGRVVSELFIVLSPMWLLVLFLVFPLLCCFQCLPQPRQNVPIMPCTVRMSEKPIISNIIQKYPIIP